MKRQPRSRYGLALVGGELAILRLEGGGHWGQKSKTVKVALWLVEDPGAEMLRHAVDREEAGEGTAPGQARPGVGEGGDRSHPRVPAGSCLPCASASATISAADTP